MITWTVGSGGLLGSGIQRHCPHPFLGSRVPWTDPDEASRVLEADLDRFRNEGMGDSWAICWAAGAATVSSAPLATAPELTVLSRLLDAIAHRPPPGRGAFFLASSAGGVYAGSAHPPFDTTTTPVPLSAYGELKLGQEALAVGTLDGICPVLIGRIGNLYGPGQNLAKLQGLISRLALAAATRQPLNIFVPLDTMRDYLYADDAGALISRWIDTAVADPASAGVRVIASGESVTVGQLIATMRLVTKRSIPLALGTHASAANQVLDLRLEPTVPAAADGIALTPLEAGTKMVFLDIIERLQRPGAME